MKPRRRILAIVFLLAASAVARAAGGSAALSGTSRLGVHGCGADPGSFSGTLAVNADGTWAIDTGEGVFAGTYVAIGRTGRKLRLALDAASLAGFVASVEADVAMLCETPPVTVTSSRAKVVSLTINRKLTMAKLVVRYLFRGNAGGRSGTATYRLVGRGAWTPG